MEEFRQLRVSSLETLATDVVAFSLEDPDDAPMAVMDPGSHITIQTPAGPRRHYSRINTPDDTRDYRIAVKAERPGRGGSASLVDTVNEGDLLWVSEPVNDFPLVEAPGYLFIAGGIGITPIYAMVQGLVHRGVTGFRLVYCTRDRASTAFYDQLTKDPYDSHVTIHHDSGDPDRIFDLWPLLETPTTEHIYCCGPRPMMDEVRDMTGHWPASSVHFEDFASDVQPILPDDRSFKVRHADTGEVVEIPADKTILEVLRASEHKLPSSCESGTCGTCKTELVAGEPDHRDLVLAASEKERFIMICVSRAASDELVLRW